jgi:hypothetical protein
MITVFVVLAMAVAACADPGVVGDNDATPENESVTDEAASGDTAETEGPVAGAATNDPGTASDETQTSEETSEVEPAADQEGPTTLTTEGKSPLATNPPKEAENTSTTSANVSGGGTVDPSLAPFIDQAKMDLADRLAVDAGAITVMSAELVEWSDASLGCPEPDMVYAQIPTDGSLIVLLSGGIEYHYHTGGSVYTPFLCE